MPTNPYTAPAISGYNSSPPPDAGEETSANTVEWAKHESKLSGPVKTLSESDITNTTSAFGKVINTDDDENNSMSGSLAFAESTLTISSGSVAATRTAHIIAAETGTTDDLANITTAGVSDNALLFIRADSGDTITVKDAATGAGEIHLADNADYDLSSDLSLVLQRRGTDWYEVARSSVNKLIQVATTQTGAVSTGTTVHVEDDGIPEITEGDEVMTLAITPKDTANVLVIEVVVFCASSNDTPQRLIAALFQDSTTNALAAGEHVVEGSNRVMCVKFTHKMTAGTVAATTFRVRIGSMVAATVTFNGHTPGRIFGGVMASSIVITETTA